MINLSKHDQDIVTVAIAAIRAAINSAEMKPCVARKICSEATKHRNKGRKAAIKNHPFQGKCEAGGGFLDQKDAVLDELEPEKGYQGKVRWVCHKANNSGKRSCGKC